MKTMTCKQLGGACDIEFSAETFDDMVALSKQHGMEMFQAQDEAHLKVMQEIQVLMQNPVEMQKWFDSKRQEFEDLAHN